MGTWGRSISCFGFTQCFVLLSRNFVALPLRFQCRWNECSCRMDLGCRWLGDQWALSEVTDRPPCCLCLCHQRSVWALLCFSLLGTCPAPAVQLQAGPPSPPEERRRAPLPALRSLLPGPSSEKEAFCGVFVTCAHGTAPYPNWVSFWASTGNKGGRSQKSLHLAPRAGSRWPGCQLSEDTSCLG